MKNITFSADERLIQRARERAAREHTNLNASFREWLARYANGSVTDYEVLMESMAGVSAGRKFSRDELNER